MTALIVLISIVLVLALLLSVSLTVYADIKEDVTIKVGAFGFKYTVVPEKEKPEREKKKKKLKKDKKPKQEKVEKAVDENSFGETINLVLTAIKSFIKPTAKLLSKVRLTSVDINIAVCDEDADETAVKFGQVTTAIYSVLGCLKSLIKVKIKRIDIRPDFVGDENRYDIFFKIKLRLYQILGAAVRILFKFVVNTIKKQFGQQTRTRPSSSKQIKTKA